jgi:hypothetical protein
MSAAQLKVAGDASAGAWIAPALAGEFGAVTLQVPSGYAAYVRICHPATGKEDAPVRWSDVAAATGRQAHPLMQWHALVGSPDSLNFTGSLWCGRPPERGELAVAPFAALCDVLAAHTHSPADCLFGIWEGWGWVHGGGVGFTLVAGAKRHDGVVPTTALIPPAFTEQERDQARLTLPDREYILLAGPLSAATQIGDPHGPRGFEFHSPNLVWPADRAWFVASEIDFDSTLVGGTSDLARAILDDPTLDAWPVEPDSSLASDADKINPL